MLRVKLADVMGIQFIRDRRVVVKFLQQGAFQEFESRYVGHLFPVPDGADTERVVNLSVKTT